MRVYCFYCMNCNSCRESKFPGVGVQLKTSGGEQRWSVNDWWHDLLLFTCVLVSLPAIKVWVCVGGEATNRNLNLSTKYYGHINCASLSERAWHLQLQRSSWSNDLSCEVVVIARFLVLLGVVFDKETVRPVGVLRRVISSSTNTS